MVNFYFSISLRSDSFTLTTDDSADVSTCSDCKTSCVVECKKLNISPDDIKNAKTVTFPNGAVLE